MDETAEGAVPGDGAAQASTATAHDDLLSRLEVIEAQPLHTRANSYAAVHDELARRLESGPASPTPSAP